MARPGTPTLWLMIAVGCGPSGPSVDGSASGGSSGTTSTGSTSASGSGPLGTTTGPGADSTTSAGTTEADGTTSDCEGLCLVDFPCVGIEQGCVDPTTIEVWQSESVRDCAEVEFGCDDVCFCMGTTCRPHEPQPCPPDHLCVEQGDEPSPDAACLPMSEVCGGPQGLACAIDQWCEYAEGLCPTCLDQPRGCGPGSPLGWCVPRPAPDDDCGPVSPGDEQCGCDGMTYANECERLQAGIALADDGPCP